MNPILLQINGYLDQVNRGEATMPSHILDEAARQFRNSLERQFSPRKKMPFRLRLSNIGKPVCQLWYEKNEAEGEPKDYSFPLRMAFGDATEVIFMAIAKAAGVDITGINEAGSITVNGVKINGTSDVTISDEIWDVKSASSYAFKEKFNSPYGYKNLLANDDFGYIAQGHGYEMAMGKPFKGWLVVSKETGDIAALEVPEEFKDSASDTVAMLERKITLLDSPEFPGREYEDVEETFKKSKTGNRILGKTCSYCQFRHTCWPDLKLAPITNSKAAQPELREYTYIDPKNLPDEN